MEILLISSELQRNRIYEKVAQKGGHSIESATTAAEALKTRKSQVDVVLLDIPVADMKGYELITEIKKKLPQCKIILVVESNFSELESTDKDEKIDYYMIRPVDESYLENIINDISGKLNSGPLVRSVVNQKLR
jgi:CheY-like chemotaxis protein